MRDGGQVTGLTATGAENASNLKEHLERLLQQADIVITTGGAASGVYDKAVYMLKHIGARLLFWGVRIKPGAHSGAAICNTKFIISLSGNPTACAVGYHLLAGPVLYALQGLNPITGAFQLHALILFQKDRHRRFLRDMRNAARDMESNHPAGTEIKYARALLRSNALIDLPSGHPRGKRAKFIYYPLPTVICRVRRKTRY